MITIFHTYIKKVRNLLIPNMDFKIIKAKRPDCGLNALCNCVVMFAAVVLYPYYFFSRTYTYYLFPSHLHVELLTRNPGKRNVHIVPALSPF